MVRCLAFVFGGSGFTNSNIDAEYYEKYPNLVKNYNNFKNII